MSPSPVAVLSPSGSVKNLYLHEQALHLDPDHAHYLNEEEGRGALLSSNSARVMFNMALALQLAVLDQTCASYQSHDLYRAEKLYELSFTLLVDHEIEFLLLVVNNLGVLNVQLNRSIKAIRCFDYVLRALMYMVDRGLCVGGKESLASLMNNSLISVAGFRNKCRIAPAA